MAEPEVDFTNTVSNQPVEVLQVKLIIQLYHA